MSDRYAPMRPRAALFALTANWVFVGLAVLALWFGFIVIFNAIYTFWSTTPRVLAAPELIDAFFIGSTPASVGWSLATFGLYVALLAAILRLFHRKSLPDLLGPRALAWRQFKRVSLYLLPFYALLLLPSLASPEIYQQMSFGAWLTLLPLMLPLLFIQISAEEFVFRGYLQSHLAALTRYPLVWMGVPAVLFGLIHYDGMAPPSAAWGYVAWATGLGLVAADLTARSGTLGPALSLHFVNNIVALLILAADDRLFGAALFIWPTDGVPWEPWIPFEALTLFTLWLIGRLALRR